MEIALSEWILEMHRDARVLRSEPFCERLFERLLERLDFQSGLLYRGAVRDGRAEFHAFYLHRQPPSLLTRYVAEGLWRVDPLVDGIVDAPGKAIRVSMLDCPRAFQPFLEDNGQRQLVSFAIANQGLQLVSGLSLYRTDLRKPFTAEEGNLLEALVPHVLDGWTQSWLGELTRSADERDEPFAIAVLTPDTTLTAAQREFEAMMAADWPHWRGPSLPDDLREHLLLRPGVAWSGRHVVVYGEVINGGCHLLRLRRRHAFDALAPRKQAVAVAFASGASQTQVAKDLHLSASTVNNYLCDVYRELHVADKVELALLMTRLQPSASIH